MVKERIWLCTAATLLLSMSVNAASANNATLTIEVRVQNIISTNPPGSLLASAEANDRSSQAEINSRATNLEHAELDWGRGQRQFKEGLIAKQDYDARKAAYDSAVAALASAQAHAEQARAQLAQARFGLLQNQAMRSCGAAFVASSVGGKPTTVTQALPNSIWGADFPGQSAPSFNPAQLETITFTTDEQHAGNGAALESSTGCQ